MHALRAKTSKQGVKVFQDNLDNLPKFTPSQPVFVRNIGKGAKWIPGTIVGRVSPRNFEVQVGDIIWKRNQEQLRPRFIATTQWSELVREPQIPEPTEELIPVMAEVPVAAPAPAASKETIPVLDTPAVNNKADATLASQDLSMQDSKPQTSI